MTEASLYCARASERRSENCERLRVVHADDLQIGMELDRLLAVGDRGVEVAAPEAQQQRRRRQRRHQRILELALLEHRRRGIEAVHGDVEQGRAHVGGAVGRLLGERGEELRLRPLELLFEEVQAMPAIAAELGTQAAQRHRLFVGFEELRDTRRRVPASRRWPASGSRSRAPRTRGRRRGIRRRRARSTRWRARRASRVRRFKKCQPLRTSSSDVGTSSR